MAYTLRGFLLIERMDDVDPVRSRWLAAGARVLVALLLAPLTAGAQAKNARLSAGATFGRILSAADPRAVQFGLKLQF